MKIDPYASGILVPAEHDRLVADIDNVARDANIPVRWVWTPLAEVCGPEEVEWVERFRFHAAEGSAGLCMSGSNMKIDPETRMAAIAGALARNFVRARVMTVNKLLIAARDDDLPDMSCLLVSNFFVEKGHVATNGHWRSEALLDAMVARHTAGLQTVLYVASMAEMALDYGLAMKRHIERLYQIVELT
jgi:hypothetical protein